jgi:glycosyltransferase involved in cell wall biosynthesis
MEKNINFNIIVPTKNRASTLKVTLDNLLNINYNNYKVIVCDCSDNNESEKIVKKNVGRIKYIRSPKEFNMSSNWEYALGIADDECYVTFIGDDDGFLPNSLKVINRLLKKHMVDAVSWNKIHYCWPDHTFKEYKNYLKVELKNSYQICNSKKRLEEFKKFTLGYDRLPCVYNSFINMKWIKIIKEKGNGIFFNSLSPDIYSGIILSCFIEKYIFSGRPFSINGISGKSNGTNCVKLPESKNSKKFFAENSDKIDKRLVEAPLISMIIAIEMLNAYNIFKFKSLEINLSKIAWEFRKEMMSYQNDDFEYLKNIFLKFIEKNNLSKKLISNIKSSEKKSEKSIKYGFNFESQSIVLNCKKFGVKNVNEVAHMVENLLSAEEDYNQENKLKLILRKILRFFYSIIRNL